MTAEADTNLSKRQLDWLPYWLAKRHWTVPEAAALLAGFLPPEPGTARALGPWLPGRDPEAWPHREAWELIVQRDLDHARQWLATIANLGAKGAKEILALAIKAGIVPPWMPALLDSEHANLLPFGLRADARDAIGAEPERPEKPKTQRDMASAGGRGKRDKNKQRAKFFPTVQSMWESGMFTAAIIRRLQEEYDPSPPPSTVYDWIREIKGSQGD